MKNHEIDTFLENKSLKSQFVTLRLDLSQVFFEIPDDLKRENRILHNLLDWVHKYREYPNRKTMELLGYDFPPIEPGIDPDSDWYRFELWMKGEPVRKTLRQQLPDHLIPKKPDELDDDALEKEFNELVDWLSALDVEVGFQEDVPLRLQYSQLLGKLDDEFELLNGGTWHLDGCSGYCPGCFQRPWCKFGLQSCWPEDEEAGTMYLPDEVKQYVSASPGSLTILQKLQAEEDAKFAKFKRENTESGPNIDPFPPTFDADDDLPF